MILHSRSKRYYNGTHRSIAPEETKRIVLAKIKSSGLPIYEKAFRIDKVDKIGLPVYAITHSNKFNNARLPSWGKGLTCDLAYVSGLMERVERYSASDTQSFVKEIIYSDFKGIKSENKISRWDLIPCNLQRKLYSKEEIDRQFRPWVKCFSLTRKKHIFIPINLVFFKSGGCQDDFSDTTGLASGNNIEEATAHGLYEVIERHLQDVVYWNRIKVPEIDINSISDTDLKKIIHILTSQGKMVLRLSYLTGDFKIPAINVFGYSKRGPYMGSYAFYSTLGVHCDKKIALMRALTEFAQTRATGLFRIQNRYDQAGIFKAIPSNIYNFHNELIDDRKLLSFDEIASYKYKDFLQDITFMVDILQKKGCEIIVKDLTHANIGIPTVRVLVRGLQPGIFGIGIVNLRHKVARISKHLHCYSYFQKKIKDLPLVDN